MSSDITVVQRTQRIIVDPASNSISILNAGPIGPGGPAGTGVVDSIIAGDNITVDDSDPSNPIISATGGGGGGGELTDHASTHGNAGSDRVSLDASQIATGFLADARIPAAITRDTELTAGLATKAALSHTHPQSDITGLVAALATKANTSALGTAAAANTTDFDPHGSSATAVTVANSYTDTKIAAIDSSGGGESWALQRYMTAGEARAAADHVIWYPDDPDLDDPLNANVDADLLFRNGLSVSGAVDSVNGQAGDVVLDADDISDSSTTKKFATAAQLTKLTGIETGADVTDAANVASAGAGVFQTIVQPINAQTGTSYSLILTDIGKFLTLSNAGAITLTVPPNASIAWPIGASIDIVQLGAGQVTVSPASGVTVNKSIPTSATRAQYSALKLVKVSTNGWVLSGDAAATGGGGGGGGGGGSGAPTLIGETDAFATTSSAVNVTLPVGVSSGDRCVVCCLAYKSTSALPSGFSALGFNDDQDSIEVRTSEKVLVSGDITAGYVTVPGDPNFNGIRYQLWFVRNSLIDVHAVSSGSDGSGSHSVSTIPSPGTTTGATDLVLVASGGRVSGTAWGSLPSGNTVDQDSPTGYVSMYAAHYEQAAGAGSSQTTTNVDAIYQRWGACAIALKAAS